MMHMSNIRFQNAAKSELLMNENRTQNKRNLNKLQKPSTDLVSFDFVNELICPNGKRLKYFKVERETLVTMF